MCGVECSGGVRGVVGQGGVGPWGLGMWGGAQVLPWKFEEPQRDSAPCPKTSTDHKTCPKTNFGFWKLIKISEFKTCARY